MKWGTSVRMATCAIATLGCGVGIVGSVILSVTYIHWYALATIPIALFGFSGLAFKLIDWGTEP